MQVGNINAWVVGSLLQIILRRMLWCNCYFVASIGVMFNVLYFTLPIDLREHMPKYVVVFFIIAWPITCFAWWVIKDRVDKPNLLKSTRHPYKNMDLAFSREVKRQGPIEQTICVFVVLVRLLFIVLGICYASVICMHGPNLREWAGIMTSLFNM